MKRSCLIIVELLLFCSILMIFIATQPVIARMVDKAYLSDIKKGLEKAGLPEYEPIQAEAIDTSLLYFTFRVWAKHKKTGKRFIIILRQEFKGKAAESCEWLPLDVKPLQFPE